MGFAVRVVKTQMTSEFSSSRMAIEGMYIYIYIYVYVYICIRAVGRIPVPY